MAGDVQVIYRKYDGSLHWHLKMEMLGADEHGIWTGTMRPTTMRKGDGPLVVLDYASLTLFPRGSWWTAAFNDAPADIEIYCDITTPAQWLCASEVTTVDLDLDVLRLRDGTVLIDDEDEFAEHQVKYGYPPHVVSEAERAAAWLKDALASDREPFAATYRSYLALLTRPDPAARSL